MQSSTAGPPPDGTTSGRATGGPTRPAGGTASPGARRPGEAGGPAVDPRLRRSALVVLGGGVVLLVVAAVHAGQGSADVGLDGVLSTLTGTASDQTAAVVTGSRVPRLLAGLVAGAALGVSGLLLQTVTRNPLAAPDTLAVNAGAYFATVLAVVGGVQLGVLPAGGVAFVGGLAGAGLAYGLATGVGATPARLLLSGMAVTLCLTSATAVLLLLFEQQTAGMFVWGQGSLVQTGSGRALALAPLPVVVAAVVVAVARRFDVLSTGDDTARALGLPVGRVRQAGLLLAVLLAAAAVTLCGPLGFVGLVAPHLVRLAGVHRHRWLVPAAGLWGACLLLAADVAARVLSGSARGGSELPAGVVTAVVGAPFFLWLARRVRAGAGTASAHAAGPGGTRLPYGVAVAVAAGALAVAGVLGLRFGALPVPWGELADILAGGTSTYYDVVVQQRAPRVLVAALAGAALAAGGLLLQAVVRNPLAEPALLGVTGGAGVGALVTLFFFPFAVVLLPVGAFLGAAVAFGVTYLVAWRGGLMPERLVLVGIGMSALTAAVVAYLVAVRQMQVAQALTWLSGSVYARSWDDVLLLAWVPLLLLPLAWLTGRRLDLFGLGEDQPRALGLRLERARSLVLALAVALVAGSVAVVGAIGFVGLIAPHAARSWVPGRHRRLLVVSALLGALLVLAADTLGRTVAAPREIPAGLLTALIGTPYFAWRLWHTRDRRL